MTTDEMLSVLGEIIYKVTGRSGLTMDTDFVKDLELNSLDVMNIICAFEDRYDTEIPTREVWRLAKVRDVIFYMEDKLKEIGRI